MNARSCPRVLIVEDEPDFRDMLSFEFSERGYRADTAVDGCDALELVRRDSFDAVVTDIRMPDMDGFELLGHIRRRSVHEPIVVLISAHPGATIEDALNLGAEALFVKPFRLAHLARTVERLLVPPAVRWGTASNERPSQDVQMHISSLDDGTKHKSFALGRGGIMLRPAALRTRAGHRLGFDIEIDRAPVHRLAGTGIVRWATWTGDGISMACGIEFEYINPETRNWLVPWLAERRMRAYIPCQPAPRPAIQPRPREKGAG